MSRTNKAREHGAALALGAMFVCVLVLSRFACSAPGGDTLQVELGFRASSSERARAFDAVLLNTLERGRFNDELRKRYDRPARRVQLARFWADVCEVRQLDFERFANFLRRAGSTRAPKSASSGHRIAGLLQSPASGVDFAGAQLYCRAAGGRLPWAEELEALATGRAGRLYPWGDEFDAVAKNFWPYQDANRNASQPCGTHPQSATPEGVQDLANNAMEWSAGARARGGEAPAAHGAPSVRANARALYALTAAWFEVAPETRSHHLGFRCVYDKKPARTLAWGARTETRVVAAGAYTVGVPEDLRLARVAVLLPAAQQREARRLLQTSGRARRALKVSRCEVSRADYRRFLRDPLVRLGLFANEHEPRFERYTPQDWQRQLENPALPVTGVNWWAADAFARWAGGRLPRAPEWQQLAAGADAFAHPWGDVYEPGAAATGDAPTPGLRACGEAARDVSGAGVADLAGNVSEWTLSVDVEQGDYAAWVAGGNWLLPGPVTARSNFGRHVPLNHKSETLGVRVVYD